MKKNRQMQYFGAFGLSMATLTMSVSFIWVAPVLTKILNHETPLNMTSNELSWVVASQAPGNLVGSVVASRITDRLGRRTTLLFSAIPYMTGAMLIISSSTSWFLYIARFLWGTGSGMIQTAGSIYTSEIADKEIRGSLAAGSRMTFNLGIAIILIIGSFISYETINYIMLILPLSSFAVCWWIPESPYYLLKEGKVDAARKELIKLNGYKDETEIEERLTMLRADVKREMQRSGSAKELFTGKRYRKAIIISAVLKLTQTWTGSMVIQYYLGPIIQETNSSIQVSTAFIIFGIMRFVISLVASFIVDKVGRRPLLIMSFSGGAVTLATIGFYIFLKDRIDLSSYRYTVFIGVTIYKMIANFGFDVLIFVVPPEIFPLNVKAKAMTALNIYSAFASFSSIRGYQIIKDSAGLQGVFWFFASSATCGAIFSYFFIPETKGKSLREIQMELQGDLYNDDNQQLNQLVNANEIAPDEKIKGNIDVQMKLLGDNVKEDTEILNHVDVDDSKVMNDNKTYTKVAN